ncbi:hypothetical protein N857_gp071 [Mycobacterium phage Wanda]|uniref:hypothetical protein n=1 Tax=Mycobacterium phage Wanda TaxID=1340713 RepID=UPI000387F073|nr:hypothetical protein N857_gp071 [Mycobacterium phage Wanda]AGT11775.1 hypothetical protein PBI_WANDA_71 [Mycobacterium phage Wanda]ATN89781.1 hypothetical protein SEA_KLEIN_66 [Mycobacterium phage Klein]AYB69548.1 hypothetical protein SEA_KALAH2_61 [Mycobacterium phage Kalah2]
MTNINTRELVSLLYEQRVRGASSAAIAEKLLEKYDITEKKPDPIGLITVSGDDSQAFRAITIKVAKSEWIDIFLDADQPERATVQRRKTPVGTSLDREVFRP